MDNLEKMDRLLEKFSLTRLNQEEIEIMNKPVRSTETEILIKNLPTNKSLGRMVSQVNSNKHLDKS